MILFKRQDKYPQIEREFTQLDARLMLILETMEAIAWHRWRDILVVTRIKDTDKSTHGTQVKPYRFIDIALLEKGDSEMLRRIINVLFPYGKEGLYTIPPLEHGTAPHFHLQVRPLNINERSGGLIYA